MNESGGDYLPAEVATNDIRRISVLTQLPHRGTSADSRTKHKATFSKLSEFELIVGLLCIALSIISLVITPEEKRMYNESIPERPYTIVATYFTYTSQGIWGGAFGVISGLLGRRVNRMHATLNHYTTLTPKCNMAMCIVTSIVNGVTVILSAFASVLSTGSTTLLAVHISIAILAFGLMILTIVHAAFCCKEGYCSCCIGSTIVIEHTVFITQPSLLPSQLPPYTPGNSTTPVESIATEDMNQTMLRYPDYDK